MLELLTEPEPGAVPQHGQNAPMAVLQLGSCASSGRAWRLRLARHTPREWPGNWPLSQTLGCSR